MQGRLWIPIFPRALLTALSAAIAAGTLLGYSGSGCSSRSVEGGNGSGGQEVRFIVTPIVASVASATPMQQITIIETYIFDCRDTANPECATLVYEDIPNDGGDWMGYPQDHSTCGSFAAEVESGAIHYSFVGTVQRVFGGGSGPFATGTYTSFEGATIRNGTFEFFEQSLTEGTSPVCPQ